MIKISKCLRCKCYIEREDMLDCCEVYPNGIPIEIFREEVACAKESISDTRGEIVEEHNGV